MSRRIRPFELRDTTEVLTIPRGAVLHPPLVRVDEATLVIYATVDDAQPYEQREVIVVVGAEPVDRVLIAGGRHIATADGSPAVHLFDMGGS